MRNRFAILILFAIAAGAAAQCGQKPEQPEWEGSPDKYIVGGREALPHYWPWQLSLQFLQENTTDDFRHTCGAVLFDPWWVLTAAHCVEGSTAAMNDSRREDPNNFRLLAGAHSQEEWIGTEQILEMDLFIKHARWLYDPAHGYPNDIALLRLTEPVQPDGETLEFACMPEYQAMNFTQSECWITGWGKLDFRDPWIPDKLQEAYIPVPLLEDCKNMNFGFIRQTHICAGEGYPNACSGDSGGPMSCYENGQWYVAGLTSWGIATCQGIPAVYTKVSMYKDWIEMMQTMYPPPEVSQL